MISFEVTRRIAIWFTQCSGCLKMSWWLTSTIFCTGASLVILISRRRQWHKGEGCALRGATPNCAGASETIGPRRQCQAVQIKFVSAAINFGRRPDAMILDSRLRPDFAFRAAGGHSREVNAHG
ncbi:MAG: hypothetical protein K8F58_06805 [Bauldia sp.]|nr:hypothetical protein [Bauldia sp.]